jgi:hypothetical protein
MDAGAFIQENKQWLIGCAIGGIVWMIGSSVIGSLYPDTFKNPKIGIPEAYDRNALDIARTANEQLNEELNRLKTELAFVVAREYSEWTGPADQHLFVSGRNLKQAIVDAASDRDCLVEDKSLVWEPVTGIDLIKKALFGLDVVDQIQQRLFAAHDQTKQYDEDAMGLVVIDSIKLESVRMNSRGRGRRRGGLNIGDLLNEQRVTMQFQADEPTVAAFLESFRLANRTLVVDKWMVAKPPRPGEPCTVKATLSGITFVSEEE